MSLKTVRTLLLGALLGLLLVGPVGLSFPDDSGLRPKQLR